MTPDARQQPGAGPSASGKLSFFLAVLRARPQYALGYGIVLLVILLTVFAPLIAPFEPEQADPVNFLHPPGWPHIMGTDATGMDIFSRVIYAPRIDLAIALAGTMVSSVIGCVLGATAGYYETKRGLGTFVCPSRCPGGGHSGGITAADPAPSCR